MHYDSVIKSWIQYRHLWQTQPDKLAVNSTCHVAIIHVVIYSVQDHAAGGYLWWEVCIKVNSDGVDDD